MLRTLKVQSIDWDSLYEEQGLGDIVEGWRKDWIDSYDVIFVDSRTGISNSASICTSQLPHILAYAFTANQQTVDGVLDVVQRSAEARDELPYDRSRMLTLPLLCRFDKGEEYERAAEWRQKLQDWLKPSYDAWVPGGVPVDRVIDNCTVPYSAYWAFGEELPVLVEDFKNPQLISYSIGSIAALIALRLDDARLFTESRDAYVDAVIRIGRRGGQFEYEYDFFVSAAPDNSPDAMQLAGHLKTELVTVHSPRPGDTRSQRQAAIDTCRHFVLLTRDAVSSLQRIELNYFLRQTLDEQSDRRVILVVPSRDALRDLPSIVQSVPVLEYSESRLPHVARAIGNRIRSGDSESAAPEYQHPSEQHLFIAHAAVDRAWAEWVVWQLADAGYNVELGGEPATDQERVVWLLSPGNPHTVTAREGLVLLRVEATPVPPPLRGPVTTTDLVGLDEEAARAELLQAVGGPLAASRHASAGPRLPGTLPPIWNIPARNWDFTGRDDLLAEIRTSLTAGRGVMERGDAATALPRLKDLHQTWQERLAPDDPELLLAATYLARAYADTDDPTQAQAQAQAQTHDLDSDTLTRITRSTPPPSK